MKSLPPLIVSVLTLVFLTAGCTPQPDPIPLPAPEVRWLGEFPRAEIWLDRDHTVNRSAVQNDSGKALQWVIVHNGREVLSRKCGLESTSFLSCTSLKWKRRCTLSRYDLRLVSKLSWTTCG
ncbi:MAG: hypothetical protein AAF086_10255, partial [Planctomycetota bacterium]